MLTANQKTALRNFVQADPILSTIPQTLDGAFELALHLQNAASPDFWVWKTSLHEYEITGTTSPDGTVWSWPAYISRSVAEQNAWVRMFNTSLTVNPSLPNVRQGIADIFSGANNNAPAQRTHLLAMARRKANKLERLFATGTGSTASPGTVTIEGSIGYYEVYDAMGW